MLMMLIGAAIEIGAEVVCVVDPHVRATDARCRQLGIEGDVLPAMRDGDERATVVRTTEDDVARLVTDEQSANHARLIVVDLHDADAVRQQVRNPDLVVVSHGHGDRLEPHRDRLQVT